jgi:ribosomal protein L35
MKTNKSFTKRLRVTRKGKILARTAGHNHFNAKRSGRERLRKSKDHGMEMTNVLRSRFLPNTPNT